MKTFETCLNCGAQISDREVEEQVCWSCGFMISPDSLLIQNGVDGCLDYVDECEYFDDDDYEEDDDDFE